jgi:hypothetical protein
VQNYEILFGLTFAVSSFEELIPAIRYIFLSTKKDKRMCPIIRTMKFWLKNTFTVESYIFDKKQKKKFIRQSNPKGMLGLIKSILLASYAC